ncbi:hypothetical protein QTP70_028369 [Hemibagrus guttatus]|uniref:EML-like second beta-propeller domain-containing protein n=1 Tax=Hemibagrus guttatus TaxID=175788 RepID=A0AAE0UI04_9TELE|nr:hypothetical protein QTP70_028369 [Hemibagrus guttatus]
MKVEVGPHHIFSLSQKARNNLIFLDEQTIVFPSGNNCALYNIHQGWTKFIPGLMLYTQEQQGIKALAISPDRRYLAVSERGVQATVSIYDLQTEQCTISQVLMLNGYGILEFVCMAFSADSKYLLCQSGGPNWNLFYWDWEKDEVIAVVNTTKVGIVTQVSFNPVDHTQICVSGKYVFKIFQLVNDCLKKIRTLNIDIKSHGNIKYHAWLPGDSIVLSTEKGKLLLLKDGELHNLRSSSERQMEKSDPSSTAAPPHITAIRAFSKGFACGSTLGEVCLYEKTEYNGYMKAAEIRIPQDACSNEPQEVIEMYLSPSEETLAISTRQGQIYHVNLASVEISQSKQANYLFHLLHLGSITGLSVCSSKTLFATCSKDNSVCIWNYKTNSLELHKEFPEKPNCISLHPNGLSIVVGFSTKVCLMNLLVDEFHTVQEFDMHDCSECVFNHDGNMFAAVTNNLISVINIRTGKVVKLNGQISKVQSVKWCKNDHHLVSCGMDGSINEWNAVTGVCKSKNKTSCSYTDVVISDSSESIISVGGFIIREVASRDMAYTAIAMTHSGQAVFVGTAAGTVRVMQYPLQEERSWTEHQAHSGPITKMFVTPDDQYLVTASGDGSLLMWSIADQNGCKLSMVKETCFIEEVLCSKAFLEKKDQSILEVQSQMELQKEELECKLNQTQVDYEKVQESFLQQIEALKDQIQMLHNEKEEQKVSQEKALAEMRENHAIELKHQSNSFENDMFKVFSVQAEMRQDYEQSLRNQEDNHFHTTMDMKRAYEQLLQQQQDKVHFYEEKLKELQENVDSKFKDSLLQNSQKLQAEKETNKTLQDEKQHMEKQIWRLKGEIQDQCLEISQLKATVEEINVKNKETIEDLQQKMKKQEEELCRERKKVINLKTLVRRMKADINDCSSFVNQPHHLRKNFIRLHKSYIEEADVRLRVMAGVVQQQTRQRAQLQGTVASLAQNQAVEPKTQQADCCKSLKQQTEVLQEVKNSKEMQNSTAELDEICLRYKQELQAEREICSQLKYEMNLLEKQMVQFWKIKGEIQDQNLEINMIKEKVQSLYDQHKNAKKFQKVNKEQTKTVQEQETHLQDIVEMHEKGKKQNKAALTSIKNQLNELIEEKKLFLKKLEAEVKINNKNQQTINELKEKLKVKEKELCTERQRVRNGSLLLDKIKADIQTCSDFLGQPGMLKANFTKLYRNYIKDAERRVVPIEDKNLLDRTRVSRTTKINARVSAARAPPKTERCPVTLPQLPSTRSRRPDKDFLKTIDTFTRKL